MIKNGLKQKTVLKRLLAGLLAAGAAFAFCACELPGSVEINYDGKEGGTYYSHIPEPVQVPEEPPVEIIDPGYSETYESSLMNFVVPNDFEKLEYFSRKDFNEKNKEIIYSDEELLTASEAYFSSMEELSDMGWFVKFSFMSLNNDNLPELVYVAYSGDPYQSYSIEFHFCTYDFETEEVVEIGSFYSQYGTTLFYSEKDNLLSYSEWKLDDPFYYNYYVTINKDNKFELVASFARNISEYDDDSECYVNHVETDFGTLEDYLSCFDFMFNNRKELDVYTLNALIPMEGNYEIIYDEYDYEDYFREYDDEYLKAASEAFVETLDMKKSEVMYTFVFLDGDNMPEMLIRQKDKIFIYKASVYMDSEIGISKYAYEVNHSGFEGDISYAEYNRIICQKNEGTGGQAEDYYLYSRYEVYPMQRYFCTKDNKFYLNDCLIDRNRYEEFNTRWESYTFTDISVDDMYTDKDSGSVIKHYNDVLSTYAP